MITIYTDGSFNIERKVGGWAAIVLENGAEMEYSGNTDDSNGLSNTGNSKTSSQRMEIIAVLEGLLTLTKPSDVEVISDSRYVVDTMSKGWLESWIRKQDNDKKHLDLWKIIYTLSKLHNLKFTWVKGHSGNHYNERCDYLAQKETQHLLTLDELANLESPSNNTIEQKESLDKTNPVSSITDNRSNEISSGELMEVNELTQNKSERLNSKLLFKGETAPFMDVSTSKKTPREITEDRHEKSNAVRNGTNGRKKAYYAVAKGRRTGILNSWTECSKSVNRYKGAIFKKFDNEYDALEFIRDNK